jgi:hypothetical protein
MKIIKSPSDFDLYAILTDLEAVLYREAFRTKTPVMIPELDDEVFIVREINRYQEKDAPKNAWRLVVRPEPDRLPW